MKKQIISLVLSFISFGVTAEDLSPLKTFHDWAVYINRETKVVFASTQDKGGSDRYFEVWYHPAKDCDPIVVLVNEKGNKSVNVAQTYKEYPVDFVIDGQPSIRSTGSTFDGIARFLFFSREYSDITTFFKMGEQLNVIEGGERFDYSLDGIGKATLWSLGLCNTEF